MVLNRLWLGRGALGMMVVPMMLASAFIEMSGTQVTAQEVYRLPPPRIVEIVDTPANPTLTASVQAGRGVLLEGRTQIELRELAQPMAKLAGIRILTRMNIPHRTFYAHAMSLIDLQTGATWPVELPPGGGFGAPGWSSDGRWFAAARYQDGGSQVWVFDGKTGKGRPLGPARLNTVLLSPYTWDRDGQHVIIPTWPADRGEPPVPPLVPPGPNVQETAGVVSKVRTYQDLLQTDHDDALFRYYAQAQLVRVNLETGSESHLGSVGLISGFSQSPDGEWWLVDTLLEPFSRIVPSFSFAHRLEVWNKEGVAIRTLATLPVADRLPIEGVPEGMRRVVWQPLFPARLCWTEAQDGGDPSRPADIRDAIFTLDAPFSGAAREIFRSPQRFAGREWLASPGVVLISDYDRDRRWVRTWLFDTERPQTASEARLLFDRSTQDRYNDPGNVVYEVRPDGQTVGILASEAIFLAGAGATPEGDRPFLHHFHLPTATATVLLRAGTDTYEVFLDFADASRTAILTQRQNPDLVPNYFRRELRRDGTGDPVALTSFPDPAPEFKLVKKELLTYQRADGIPLSGMLYYPLEYEPGKRYPAVVWAYPREYTSPATAGQVRAATNRYTRIANDSILFFVLQGYAVLNSAEIPVVGDPLTANDTFVEQIKMGAEAAVNALVDKGIADRHRIGVAGHSYGAFMVANLLAHTDLFAAGIARSGAYNRTLTPFGFQGERRTFWEAPGVYTTLSAFTHGDKINEPLLLTHGELDPNPGTFPMQSERLFAAIRGHGGTARLVVLPFENHGYEARESILHVLAESFEWFDRHVKNRPGPGPVTATASDTSDPTSTKTGQPTP
jgi:dipeptidyl aminopeptidase/acylaminoacyl peptidase